MPNDIVLDRDGGVLHVLFNRPDSLNGWTPEMGNETLSALRSASIDPDVRAVVLSGAGKGFSSGADLKVEREYLADDVIDLSGRLKKIYNQITLEIRSMPKPVIAAVHGPAAGVGCSYALACDFLIMEESSYLLLAFVRVGLVPDGGASILLPARVGWGRAQEMAMLGSKLPAAKAVEWGAANEVVPDGGALDRAQELAAQLAQGPTVAYGCIKEEFNASCLPGLAAQLELEARLQQRQAAAGDYAEGVAAFKEKRPAEFKGV